MILVCGKVRARGAHRDLLFMLTMMCGNEGISGLAIGEISGHQKAKCSAGDGIEGFVDGSWKFVGNFCFEQNGCRSRLQLALEGPGRRV